MADNGNAAGALLSEAERSGVRLVVQGGKLGWRGQPSTELLEKLDPHRSEIIAVLNARRDAELTRWWDGVRDIRASSAPPICAPGQWFGAGVIAQKFLEHWGDKPFWLGWTTVDLFGAHVRAPFGRLDFIGLTLCLGPSKHVGELTETDAKICYKHGRHTTYYKNRRQHPEFVPIWELSSPFQELEDWSALPQRWEGRTHVG